MKNTKRSFVSFRYRDCDAFADYLHEQSLQGWHFKEWRLGMVFERGEPQEVRYAVEVFPKGSEMDTKPGPEAEEYAEYCAAAGWELIDGMRRFCVFRQTGEHAVPIVEPGERYDNVRRAEWKEWRNISITPLILAAIWGWGFFTVNFEHYIFSNVMLFFLLVFLLEALVVLKNAVSLLIWSHRAKRKLAEGSLPDYGGGRRQKTSAAWNHVRWWAAIAALCIAVLLAYQSNEINIVFPAVMMAVCLVTLGVVLALLRPSREDNQGIQLAAGVAFPVLILVIGIAMITSDAGSGVGPDPVPGNEPTVVEDGAPPGEGDSIAEGVSSAGAREEATPGQSKEPSAGAGSEVERRVQGFPLWQRDYDPTAGTIIYADSGVSVSVLGSESYFYVNCMRGTDTAGEAQADTADEVRPEDGVQPDTEEKPALKQSVGAKPSASDEAPRETDSLFLENILSYTIYQSRYSWVLDQVWAREADWYDGAADCAAQWQADAALRRGTTDGGCRYLMRYEGRVIVLAVDEEPDASQTGIIREKLLGYNP